MSGGLIRMIGSSDQLRLVADTVSAADAGTCKSEQVNEKRLRIS